MSSSAKNVKERKHPATIDSTEIANISTTSPVSQIEASSSSSSSASKPVPVSPDVDRLSANVDLVHETSGSSHSNDRDEDHDNSSRTTDDDDTTSEEAERHTRICALIEAIELSMEQIDLGLQEVRDGVEYLKRMDEKFVAMHRRAT